MSTAFEIGFEKRAGLISAAAKEFEAGGKTLADKTEKFVSKTKPTSGGVLDYSKFNTPRVWSSKPKVQTVLSEK
jgi:hypothetical protein